jgi:hypothetical protein
MCKLGIKKHAGDIIFETPLEIKFGKENDNTNQPCVSMNRNIVIQTTKVGTMS